MELYNNKQKLVSGDQAGKLLILHWLSTSLSRGESSLYYRGRADSDGLGKTSG